MKSTLLTFLFIGMALSVFSQKFMYKEDFNDNKNRWPVGVDETSATKIENGHYYFKFFWLATRPHYNMWNDTSRIILPLHKNYKIETSLASNTTDTATSYGIRFNNGPAVLNPEKNGWLNINTYAFVLRPDGYVALFNRQYGKVKTYNQTPLTPWTKVSKYYTGKDNNFTVINHGDEFTFYLNGVKVFTKTLVLDQGIADVGFKINGNTAMVIDHLYINEL